MHAAGRDWLERFRKQALIHSQGEQSRTSGATILKVLWRGRQDGLKESFAFEIRVAAATDDPANAAAATVRPVRGRTGRSAPSLRRVSARFAGHVGWSGPKCKVSLVADGSHSCASGRHW